MRLTAYDAIIYAEAHGLTLSKYNDPTEDAREGLTPEAARKIALEDLSLIYVDVPVRYEVRLSGVPDGAQVEDYLCGPSNGDGSPDRATRYFPTRKAAEQVVREFYAAKRARPQDFEPEMEATIVRL